MQRWNFRDVSIYSAVITVIIVYTFLESLIPINPEIVMGYQKILSAVPVLFLVAAFLAFKIAETGMFLAALSFLILSLAQSFDINTAIGLSSFFRILPLIFPFTLSIIFLVPGKIRNFSMFTIKALFAVFPAAFFFFPETIESFLFQDLHYGRIFLPLPSLTASLMPLIGPLVSRDRKISSFSAALSSAFILFMLPFILSLEGYLSETCSLAAGMIIIHSLYRVYWENSYIDELTGLSNRRALDEKMRRLGSGYSLAMVDVDHFKSFNDTYGHDEGDNVLRLVASILSGYFGKHAYRYGGEEFCVVFLRTGSKSAFEEIDEARTAIESHGFSIRQSNRNRKKSSRSKLKRHVKKVRLTVSAGVAEAGKSRRAAESVLKQADKALYAAKENGRNCVNIV